MGLLIQLGFLLFLLILGYLAGSIFEKKHYKSIYKREKETLDLVVVNVKKPPIGKKIVKSHFVSGSVVISLDYFKRFLASLKNLVGGRIGSYESLLDRARREAILRMKDKALEADMILNLRLESCAIGKSADSKKQIGSIEVVAYGTAIYYE